MATRHLACAYCHAEIPFVDQAPPAVDDDAAWARIAEQHGVGCEWIATRAHQLEGCRGIIRDGRFVSYEEQQREED
jgi:hypothetical protein